MLGFHAVQIVQRDERRGAGVIDQDVQPTKGFLGRGDHLAASSVVCHVGLDDDSLDAELLEFGSGCFGLGLRTAVIDEHGAASSGQLESGCPSYAGSAS